MAVVKLLTQYTELAMADQVIPDAQMRQIINGVVKQLAGHMTEAAKKEVSARLDVAGSSSIIQIEQPKRRSGMATRRSLEGNCDNQFKATEAVMVPRCNKEKAAHYKEVNNDEDYVNVNMSGTLNHSELTRTDSDESFEFNDADESNNSSSTMSGSPDDTSNGVPITRSSFGGTGTAPAVRLTHTALPARPYSSPLEAASINTTTSSQESSATRLKRSFDMAAGVTPSGKRLTGELDPENQEIKRLRQEEDLDFDKIADKLNEARCKVGKEGGFTANAVYSRYKRNGPLIAAMNGEIFKPTAKDNKFAHIKFQTVEPVAGWDDAQDELLVRAEREITQTHWELVSQRIMDLGGQFHEPSSCQRRSRYI